MADISTIKRARFKEAETARHRFEMKKIREENQKQRQEIVENHDVSIEKMEKTFKTEESKEKIQLERELNFIRAKYAEMKRKENSRFEAEIRDLRKAHDEQRGEVTNSHAAEAETVEKSHRNFMENARKKFLEEKAKYETS